MKTVITKDVELCQQLLNANEVVAVPTETVYGLAACITEDSAVEQIFKLKSRPHYNPLIVHIHSIDQLNDIASDIPENAYKLAEKFWPGPLTLLLNKQTQVSDLITAGKPTVAVRMPNHPLTLELLKGLKAPIAAPSANPFTGISPTSAQHVFSYFNGKIKAVLDGGQCQVGLESTIIGFIDEIPTVFRKGGISIDRIEAIVGKVGYLKELEAKNIIAPGMLDKHYAPKTKMLLVDDFQDVLEHLRGKKIGLVTLKPITNSNIKVAESLSVTGNLDEAAANLYATLHYMDMHDLDIIVVEKMPDKGIGLSINDRLKRASHA